MRTQVWIRSIHAYERLLEAGLGLNLLFAEGQPTVYHDSHIARLPEAVRTLLDQLKAEGLVEMEPYTGPAGSRWIPSPEEARRNLRCILRERVEGKITIQYFTHNGEQRFVYREQVPDAERVRGTIGIYEYIGVIPPTIQQHGEQMTRWYVEKTARADIERQKHHDSEVRKEE